MNLTALSVRAASASRQRDRVGDHHFLDARSSKCSRPPAPESTGCEAAGVHRRRPVFHQRRGRLHQRSRRIDQVVDDQARAARERRRSRASLRPHSSPTRRLSTMASAASIFFAKNRARSTPPASGETTVRFGRFSLLEVIHQHRRREQMIHRDIEKSLQLRRMQIHNQRPIRARGGQQIGHQLRRNRARAACPCGPAARIRSTESPP